MCRLFRTCEENMVVQFWTIIAVPASGYDSARCGRKYIRNKLRTSVFLGTVVTVVLLGTPVQIWTILTKTTFTHF